MKRLFSIMVALTMIVSLIPTVALAAAAASPTFTGYDAFTINDYDISDGSLRVSWTASNATRYYVKAIMLDEVPVSGDNTQADRAVYVVKDDDQTSKYITISTTKLKKAAYLKVAVGAMGSGESLSEAHWSWVGFRIVQPQAKPAEIPAFTGYAASKVHDYDIDDGTLRLEWTSKNAEKYIVKAIMLNEVPVSGDETQSNRAVYVVKDGTQTSDYLSISKTKLKKAAYLKVAVGAMGDDESQSEAHWAWVGFRIIQDDAGTISLSKTSWSPSYQGDKATITVNAASSYTVSYPSKDAAAEGARWLTVTQSGSKVTLAARPNYGASARSETVTFTDRAGNVAKLKVTQNSGYAAPNAILKIGSTVYADGSTYGPLANTGSDVLYLAITATNARRIHVDFSNGLSTSCDFNITASASGYEQQCYVPIPKDIAAGQYTLTIYVSNSDVKNDSWKQQTKKTLNVKVVGSGSSSSHKYYVLGGYIDYIPGQDYFTASKKKECISPNSNKRSPGSCKSLKFDGASQCAGFAKYVEHTIYGGLGSYLDERSSGLLSSSNVSVDKLKTLIQRAGVGANIRAGTNDDGHSMIVLSVSDSGFRVLHANWDDLCAISEKTFTWQAFKDWLNKKNFGIAYIRVHNSSPVQEPYPPIGSTLLEVARSQIGYKGSSTSSNLTGANVATVGNWTKYGEYTGSNNANWCASFVAWCGDKANVSNIKKSAAASPQSLCSNYNTEGAIAYFNEVTALTRANHPYLETYGVYAKRGSVIPAPGDLVFFLWSSDRGTYTFSHVGIVSSVSGGKMYYIDGNGSGDIVKERSMSLTSTDIAAFCKVSGAYTAAATPKPTATPTPKPTATPTPKPTATPTAKPTATPTAGVAVSEIVFSSSNTSATKGSTVTIPVYIQNPDSIMLEMIEISYNLPAGVTVSSVSSHSGTVLLDSPTVVAYLDGVSGGNVMSVELSLDDSVTFPVKISMTPTVYPVGNNADYTLDSFSVSIQEDGPSRLAGDVNEDGRVDLRDALAIVKYEAGWDITINTANANVNGDNRVDLRDALLIVKYEAGWDVVLK